MITKTSLKISKSPYNKEIKISGYSRRDLPIKKKSTKQGRKFSYKNDEVFKKIS